MTCSKYDNEINLTELNLSSIKDTVIEILEDHTQKIWQIDIHITTQLDKVKANVQGNIGHQFARADILISGELKFGKLFKAIAHELCHLIYPHIDEHRELELFEQKVKQLEKEIKQKLNKERS